MVCNFSFIASVLAGKNQQNLNLAQQMVDILMEKLPKVFSKVFMSEGSCILLGSSFPSNWEMSLKDQNLSWRSTAMEVSHWWKHRDQKISDI